MSEQAHQRRDDPILLRADGLYYDKGIFDEAVVQDGYMNALTDGYGEE